MIWAARHNVLNSIMYQALTIKRKEILRNVKMIICTLMGGMKIANGLSIWTPWLEQLNRKQIILLDEFLNSGTMSADAASQNSCALVVAADSTQDCMSHHEYTMNMRMETQLVALDPIGPSCPEGNRRVARPLLSRTACIGSRT